MKLAKMFYLETHTAILDWLLKKNGNKTKPIYNTTNRGPFTIQTSWQVKQTLTGELDRKRRTAAY